MKIYYGSMKSVKFEPGEINELGSLISFFPYQKKFIDEKSINIKKPFWCDSYFLDSGAFSAWRQKKPIKLDNYINFCYKYKDHFNIIANLDVIGDPKKSYENYIEIKKQGLNILPIFHQGSDFELLFKYADHSNFIGIGNIAKASSADRKKLLNYIFNNFPDPNKTGFHGFGVMDENLILKYPWKTIDSTSIHMQARYGGIYTPFNKWLKINPNVAHKDVVWQTPNQLKIIKKWIKDIGYDWEKAIEQNNQGVKERCLISINIFEILAKKCPEYFKSKNNYLF